MFVVSIKTAYNRSDHFCVATPGKVNGKNVSRKM